MEELIYIYIYIYILSQLISEPANLEPHKYPSFIHIFVTGQPNIIFKSGTRASLDSCCHHHRVYCKMNGILIGKTQVLLKGA